MNAQHTPEPWHVTPGGRITAYLGTPESVAIATFDRRVGYHEAAANACRAAACVNACKGISDNDLALLDEGTLAALVAAWLSGQRWGTPRAGVEGCQR